MDVQEYRLSEQACGTGGVRNIMTSRPDDAEVSGAARTDACVLLSGEAGAVQALAQRIHTLSGWRQGPFVTVNCAWPDAMLDARLFGMLGDQVAGDAGLPTARLSQSGTVFLQEVGSLSAAAQSRLADYLGELRAHGGDRRARRRVMASTSEDLLERVNAGTFDGQLFYRLNVMHLIVPGNEGKWVRQ